MFRDPSPLGPSISLVCQVTNLSRTHDPGECSCQLISVKHRVPLVYLHGTAVREQKVPLCVSVLTVYREYLPNIPDPVSPEIKRPVQGSGSKTSRIS